MALTSFVIVADLRTGSTLLSTTLHRHPQIRCPGELFHAEDFPDNRLQTAERRELDAEALIDRALTEPGVRAAGFRILVQQPDATAPAHWSGAWQALSARRALRVVFLRRADLLAQYVSFQIARKTGPFTPSPEDPILEGARRPALQLDPGGFRAWMREREQLCRQRRLQIDGKPRLELTYEALTSQWQRQIHRIQRFLGVKPLALGPAKEKQESRPLSEVVTNYEELRKIAEAAGTVT